MNIKIELGNKNSIQKAIKEIERYKKTLKSKVETFLLRVGELGVNIANTYISAYSIPSEVIGQIKIQKGDIVVSGGTIQIIITNDEALFWEYGTGLTGEENPHPNTDGWKYNYKDRELKTIKELGQEFLWVYSKNQGGLTQWAFEYNGAYFTKGMPSQPFMYQTYNDLLKNNWSQIVSIAKEVFSE